MAGLFGFLQSQPFFSIFLTVALGMWLGRKQYGGISLGSVVCIILVGLVLSTAAFELANLSLALPDVLKTVFFNLFIFAIGVKIGPQFFAGLERDGWRLIAIGAVVAVLAPVLAYACGWYFQWPQGTVAGVLAGSNNSSATFGAATAAVQSDALQLAPGNSRELVLATLSAAFALCYTVGQVLFVVLMKLMPTLAGFDPAGRCPGLRGRHAARKQRATARHEGGQRGGRPGHRRPRSTGSPPRPIGGRTVREVRSRGPARVPSSWCAGPISWLTPGTTPALEAGDQVVVSAPLASHVRVREALGPEVPDTEARARLAVWHTVDVVIGRHEAAGRADAALLAEEGPGLYANALFRVGEELPLATDVALKVGDVIRVTGADRTSRRSAAESAR